MISPPPELAKFSAVIQPPALLALIERYGGCLFSVPLRAGQSSRLAALIGHEAAAALCAAFGGEKLHVPLGKSWRCQVYAARGDGVMDIARRLTMSRSSIQRILNGSSRAAVQRGPRGD